MTCIVGLVHEEAWERLPGADIRVADCNHWPFPDVRDPFAVADFDPYSDPYRSFEAFWGQAEKVSPLVLFFTDWWCLVAKNAENAAPIKGRENQKKFDRAKKDQYLALLCDGIRRGQAAHQVGVDPTTVQRHMQRYPSFAQEVSQAEMLANEEVENALYTAAVSGNVTACQVWLYNRLPDAWADRRNIKAEISGKDGGPIQVDVAAIEAKIRALGETEE